MARDGFEGLGLSVGNLNGIVAAAKERHVNLVVVGPEAPLVEGLVDMLGEAGVRAFGPTAAAAKIEGSKAYAKELMQDVRVPTASYMVFHSREEALAQLPCASYPAVLKADVLAAGKGVIICESEQEARAAVEVFFGERRFGHTTVVLEEFLRGEELSLFALCDGVRAVPMTPAQDYKRIFDMDQGPNTGGMGSYSPVPKIDDDLVRDITATVHQPIVDELRARGTPFHGVLYAGIMLTADGPKVLEYNVRFGDPETQAVLPRMRTDLLSVLTAAAQPGGLADMRLQWLGDWAVTVVLASAGYPSSARTGDVISGLDEVAELVEVTHAGTAAGPGGSIVTAGGRVLSVTALGSTVARARDSAYAAARAIEFDGRQMREDIALRAVERASG
jgi:phosphoribosylamine--glycine ligase